MFEVAHGEEQIRHLAGDLGHWRAAVHSLGDLDSIAAPAAWASLERYLGARVRQRLTVITSSLVVEADRLAAALLGARASDVHQLRTRLLDLRRRYLQAETIIDFYAQAVNHRTTPRLGSLMRGLDSLAVDSMQVLLRPFGIEAPPVLTYIGEGLGASILRAGVRLWDGGALSPAAAIKVSQHQLYSTPTSLLHESGHQVAHLLHWNAELAEALWETLSPVSPIVAAAWRDWASEVAADVHAFALLGYGAVPPLTTVVDGSTDQVLHMPLGDPHPFGWIRVLFNVELCRAWYGQGPWDELATAWLARHPIDQAPPGVDHIAQVSQVQLRRIVDVCTRRPMRAFGGKPLYQLADPSRVHPTQLAALAARAGESLYTSTYLQRHESLRILAWNSLQVALAPQRAPELSRQLMSWLMGLGAQTAELAA